MPKIKQRRTGGHALREKYGNDYFSKLAKKGWPRKKK